MFLKTCPLVEMNETNTWNTGRINLHKIEYSTDNLYIGGGGGLLILHTESVLIKTQYKEYIFKKNSLKILLRIFLFRSPCSRLQYSLRPDRPSLRIRLRKCQQEPGKQIIMRFIFFLLSLSKLQSICLPHFPLYQ